MSLLKWTKQKLRATNYLFNGCNEIERYVLEATNNEFEILRDIQKETCARLTYEDFPYENVKNILRQRLCARFDFLSKRKSLEILIFMVTYGDEKVRKDLVDWQQLIESCSYIDKHKPAAFTIYETSISILAQDLLVLTNIESEYNKIREENKEKIEKIKNYQIKTTVVPPQHRVITSSANVSPKASLSTPSPQKKPTSNRSTPSRSPMNITPRKERKIGATNIEEEIELEMLGEIDNSTLPQLPNLDDSDSIEANQ